GGARPFPPRRRDLRPAGQHPDGERGRVTERLRRGRRGARGGVPPPLAVAGPARVKAPASGAGAFGQVDGRTIRDRSPSPRVVGPVPIACHTSTRIPPPGRFPSAPDLECRPAAWV